VKMYLLALRDLRHAAFYSVWLHIVL